MLERRQKAPELLKILSIFILPNAYPPSDDLSFGEESLV
jgi:hypothetical protein